MAGFGEKQARKKERHQQKTKASGRSHLKNGLQHHMLGDLDSAESEYRKAMQVGYYNYAMFINLGVICKNSGRPEEAIILYKKAIKISPNEPDAYSNLGNLYQSLGNFESAIACSSKSLEIKPNNPETLVTLGWCQKELGNLNQALTSTLKSLELKPDNPNAYMNVTSTKISATLIRLLPPLSNHSSSSLITQMPSPTWAPSTKTSANLIRLLPPLSNHSSSSLITHCPYETGWHLQRSRQS